MRLVLKSTLFLCGLLHSGKSHPWRAVMAPGETSHAAGLPGATNLDVQCKSLADGITKVGG